MGFAPGFLHPSGAILVDDSGLISQSPGLLNFVFANGLKLNNAGQLATKLGGAVAGYNNGLPVTAAGELCVSYLNDPTAGVVPALNLDFVAMNGVLDPRITFQRNSNGTYWDATGMLQTAGPNVPRFGYDNVTLEPLGMLYELASTNTIQNNTMVGAVAGTPGTQPNLWNMDSSGNGLVRTIVGTGQELGIDFMDVRFAGTPIASTPISIAYVGLNVTAGTPAQVQGMSAFYRLMAGSTAGAVFNQCISASDGTQYLGDVALPFVPSTDLLRKQRPQAVGNLTAFPTTTRVVNRLRVDVTAGVPVDFTIRIGLPQNDSSAVLSTPIKTTAAALGRILEVAFMDGANFSWYVQGEGTLYADYTQQNLVNGNVWAFSDGTTANGIREFPNTFNVGINIVNGGVSQGSPFVNTPGKLPFQRWLTAAGWATNNLSIAVNGSLSTPDTLVTIPVTLNQFRIGSQETGVTGLGGAIRKIVYFPQRFSDAQLASMTENTFWVGGVLVGNSSVRITRA